MQQQRNSLSDKHLRPLEDNPLRLNMDYATALDVMFAEGKSPVDPRWLPPPSVKACAMSATTKKLTGRRLWSRFVSCWMLLPQNLLRRFVQYRRSHELRERLDDVGAWQMYSHYYEELASDRQQGFEMLFNEVYAQVMTGCFVKTAGAGSMNRKAFLACVLMCVILTGCETAKKISEVIKNPDIQVGSLKEQPSEITVTLLTEPDTNTNAEGESAAVDVQLDPD